MKILLILATVTLNSLAGSWSSSLLYSKVTGEMAEDRDHNGLLGFNFGYNHDLNKHMTLGADIGFSVNFSDLDEDNGGHLKSMIPLLLVGRYFYPASSNFYPFLGLGLGYSLMKLEHAPEDNVSSFTFRPSIGANFGNFSVELTYSMLGKHEVYDNINIFTTSNSVSEKKLNTLAIMFTWGFHRMGMTDNQLEQQRKKLQEMEKKEVIDKSEKNGTVI